MQVDDCDGIWLKSGVWVKLVKKAKIAKMDHLAPLFGFCKGLVVIQREGCGVLGEFRLTTFDPDYEL